MTWTIVIIAAIVLVILTIAILLLLRRRRRQRGAVAQPSGQPAPSSQIADIWTRFYRDVPVRAHHFPTVIVLGDAGSGKSHLIDERVDWRGQANQFFPSSVDSPHLQLYLGSDVVVHELSAPLLRDIGSATRRALVRLWRHVGPSATVVVVLDARAVSTTPPETLRELGQLVRGKIGALPARCRDTVEVRVCLSHMDQIDGYDELVAVVGAHHGAFDVGALSERLVDARALVAAAEAVMAKYDANLAYGLASRTGDAFARLVGFYTTFPVLLTQLAPLLRSLAGDDPDQRHYAPSQLYLTSIVPDNHVGDPFVVDHALVTSSITRQRRLHRRGSLAVALAGIVTAGALMWWHAGRVNAAEAAVEKFVSDVSSGSDPSDSQLRRVGAALEKMHQGERLWLDHSFVERKRELAEEFAQELREEYVLPLLERDEPVNRSTILYAVALLYASEANGLRALIRGHVDLWVTKLGLTAAIVSTYLDVSSEQYQTAVQFSPTYTGSDWQSYVFDKIKPLYVQTTRLTQAQLDDLDLNQPQLYDQREYAVRARVIDLLRAQVALATQPPIAKLLDSPLGRSEWVEQNAAALRGISAEVSHKRLAQTSPHTLGELGTDLERIMILPPHEREVYAVSRDKNGITERFELDVAAWHQKLAAASAALTISAVHDQNTKHPKEAIGFFAAGPARGTVGAGTGAQGPSVGIPTEYTAGEFEREVAPALEFITKRAGKLSLASDDQATLAGIYREQIDDYAERYAGALRAYYDSFRFEPGNEDALPYALAGLTQPSSWFLDFLTMVSVTASPRLGDGAYYEVMADNLADFRALAELLASAKGTIPGLAPYQQLIAELVAVLDPDAPVAAADPAALPTLASTLSRAAAFTLNKLTGAEKDRQAQVNGWLTGANVDRSLHDPFLAPVRAVYSLGAAGIRRAVGQAWTNELAPLIAPLLARFPFSTGASRDVAIADLEAVVRAQGKQPGSFWTAFQRWLGPVTVQKGGKYQWLAGVSGPTAALATANDLARLSRALWDADGNPTALPIEIIPQPLDADPASGRVPTLAYLRSGSGAVYAFNQRPGPSTLALQWWDQGASSIIIKLSKPGTTDTATFSIDEAEAPFSFFRLLCRARVPTTQRTAQVCEPGRGARVWDIPLGGNATRSITLTLDTDPWALFRIAR